jgi:hypothetical protein
VKLRLLLSYFFWLVGWLNLHQWPRRAARALQCIHTQSDLCEIIGL